MKTKRRSHKNTPRLTAAERVALFDETFKHRPTRPELDYLVRMLADHARETLARYKRRQAKRGGA